MLSPLGPHILLGPRPPRGYLPVPLADGQGPIRLCVLVAETARCPVSLRDTFDARVFLACLADLAGTVHRWLELWVQDVDGLAASLPAKRQVLTNATLDRRFASLAQTAAHSDPASLLSLGGTESDHPVPAVIDSQSLRCTPLTDPATGETFQLCQDDPLLTSLGLDPYSTSLHRYLYLPSQGPSSPFLAVTTSAKTNPSTRPLASLLAPNTPSVPLNPGGGLMLARPLVPFPFEPYADFLSGAPPEEILRNDPLHKLFTDEGDDPDPDLASPVSGWLLPADPRSRLLEAFHLKLSLLADAIAAVRRHVRATQAPLLNVGPDSFRVGLGEPSPNLPALWTASVHLVKPGDAIEVPVPATDAHYYLPGRPASSSVYRPPPLGSATQGHATVRVRRTLPGPDGSLIIEGTLSTQDLGRAPRNDLLSLRLNLPTGRADFFARLEAQTALAAGEWRFRTIERAVPPGTDLDGASFADVPFETLPAISTPCDLYALAVLAVRTLLVDPATTLPEALDDLQSLARQTAAVGAAGTPLPDRIAGVVASDDRWLQSLGPHRLTHRRTSPQDALDLVPARLWWETLAAVVRMLPGADPESACRDFGDARPGGLHKTFDRAAADLQALLTKSRGLIVVDWTHNREIDAVIRSELAALAEPSPPT